MKNVIILGAGQMGRAAARLLNPNTTRLIALADNNQNKWTVEDGGYPAKPDGRPIISVETAVKLVPDEIIISVLDDERAQEMTEQVRACGFSGNIMYLKDLHTDFDIRSRCIRELAELIKRVEGDVAELGVFRGDTAWQLNEIMPDRTIYLFDTFEGFDEADLKVEGRMLPEAGSAQDFSDTTEERVMARMPFPDKVVIRKGYFPETLEGFACEKFALVSLDPDLYAPALAGLKYFYPRMSEGGVIVVHDYNNLQFTGIKQAVTEYNDSLVADGCTPLKIVPLGDLHGSVVIIK